MEGGILVEFEHTGKPKLDHSKVFKTPFFFFLQNWNFCFSNYVVSHANFQHVIHNN